ncbi:hypothetical protein MLD38_015586 [Melastoma candidum]|uniref:Uncharacterized protein n=1 Tax=Melastoma candidum TaxID=119954 RepID=A0ACB9RGD4_9MYRT|nr:hypothetical protein MLD38_015586 [Melastoma candidum]
METVWSYEQKALISELIQGMEFAKQLRMYMMASAAPADVGDMLIRGIMSSFEKALLVLKWNGPVAGQCSVQRVTSASGIPESPLSVNGSPHSDDLEKGIQEQFLNRDLSKKRKLQPKWTDQVRVNPETGLEGPHDDGYNWRKYGQKDILGAKYPRSYYRCTYRNTQNCWATKQVQRSDEDPTVFEITYRGTHTCAPAAPVSPEKKEQKQTHQNNCNKQQQQQPEEALLRLKSGLRVNTSDLDDNEIAKTYQPFSFPTSAPLPLMRSEFHNSTSLVDISRSSVAERFSHSFISPSTPESNYFPGFQRQAGEFGKANVVQNSDSDRTEIISVNTSSDNSPIIDLDFLLDQVGIGSHFPFDSTFFS